MHVHVLLKIQEKHYHLKKKIVNETSCYVHISVYFPLLRKVSKI